jgi:hypothetical protein
MKVFAYNLTLFTVEEVEIDKVSDHERAIKIIGKGKKKTVKVFHKWSPNREMAVGHVIDALDKEIQRRQDGIDKLEKIKDGYKNKAS